MSTAVTKIRAYSNKYQKDFDAIVAFLTQYIDKRAPTHSVKVASAGQNRTVKWQKSSTIHGIFKVKIVLKKYCRDKYDSMAKSQCQQLYELQTKARLIKG